MVNPFMTMLMRPHERIKRARSLQLTTPESVREEQFVRIGGIEQWVTVRGRNRGNPMLLHIHGGPGSPYTPFNSWLGEWEAEFTVVQWDQRGAGRTFIAAGDGSRDLSLSRLADDGIDLAEQLGNRFGQPIVLVGSSIGSLIGAIMAKRRPDLFAALVCANVFAPESAAQSYQLTLAHAQQHGDRRAIAALTRIGPDPSTWAPRQAEDVSKLAIAATTGVPNLVYDLMLPALMYAPDLSMSDIRAIDRGMKASLEALQPEYAAFDFDALGYDWALPYLIVQGASDLVSPVTAARTYFERVTAPTKRMIEVDGAGHLVEFADRSRFLKELRLLEITSGPPTTEGPLSTTTSPI